MQISRFPGFCQKVYTISMILNHKTKTKLYWKSKISKSWFRFSIWFSMKIFRKYFADLRFFHFRFFLRKSRFFLKIRDFSRKIMIFRENQEFSWKARISSENREVLCFFHRIKRARQTPHIYGFRPYFAPIPQHVHVFL